MKTTKIVILTISGIKQETVVTLEGKNPETVIRFKEAQKPMILNVTNAKIITKLYDSPFIEDWIDKKIQV